MSDKTVVRVLDQYRTKEAAGAAHPNPDPLSSRRYKAYGVQPPRSKVTDLRLIYADGSMGLISKLYRSEVMMTSHTWLSIVFDNCSITLQGRNLDQLIDLIQDDEIRSLHCFNPALHDPPPDGEILITTIERINIHEFRGKINQHRKV